jgi:hypothetical protein
MKYILVHTFSTKEQNPYWLASISNIEPQYIPSTRTCVMYFGSDRELSDFLAVNHDMVNEYRVFEVARELRPTIQTEVTVSFKTK